MDLKTLSKAEKLALLIKLLRDPEVSLLVYDPWDGVPQLDEIDPCTVGMHYDVAVQATVQYYEPLHGLGDRRGNGRDK